MLKCQIAKQQQTTNNKVEKRRNQSQTDVKTSSKQTPRSISNQAESGDQNKTNNKSGNTAPEGDITVATNSDENIDNPVNDDGFIEVRRKQRKIVVGSCNEGIQLKAAEGKLWIFGAYGSRNY